VVVTIHITKFGKHNSLKVKDFCSGNWN